MRTPITPPGTIQIPPLPVAENGCELASRQKQTIWFVNEHATTADDRTDKLRERHDNLHEAQPNPSTWIATTGDETALEHLAKTVEQSDEAEIIAVGGDGTLHCAVHALLSRFTTEELQKKKIVISVIGFGKENDVAHALHGNRFDDVAAILQGTDVRPFSPLIVEKLEGSIWQHVETAVYAFGAGGTAEGAKKANNHDYRANNKRRPETLPGKLRQNVARAIGNLTILRSYWNAEIEIATTLQDTADASTVTGKINDMTVANGGIMAGLMLFPAHLRKPGFFVSVTPNRLGRKLYSLADRIFGQGASGWMVEDGNVYQFQLAQKTLVHADGEPFELEPGTYRIRASEASFLLRAANTEHPQHSKAGDLLAALGEAIVKTALRPIRDKH